MAINTTGITTLYDTLIGAVITKLDNLYTDNKIDAETYARLLSESIHQTMQTSIQAIQNQEQLEADSSLKNSQKDLFIQQKLTEAEQTSLVSAQAYIEIQSKTTSVNAKAKQLDILGQQLTNMIEELEMKGNTVDKSLLVQDAQIAQMNEEKLYTIKKTDVLEKSRLDNKRINAAKEYQEFLGMLSANVVPSSTDIANCRLLMKNIIDETNTTIVSTTPTIAANGSSYNATVTG